MYHRLLANPQWAHGGALAFATEERISTKNAEAAISAKGTTLCLFQETKNRILIVARQQSVNHDIASLYVSITLYHQKWN